VTPLDDPADVASQYAREDNLNARRAFWTDAEGTQPWEILENVLRGLTPSRVIEVGGGPGELAEWIQTELGADVEFVDISARMVELASARGVRAQVGSVEDLPFPDAAFDVAVAAWMLYHVAKLEQGIAELARVLGPGGTLVAVTTSTDHMREFRDLVGYPDEAREKFSRENGAELLARHFSRVERHDAEVKVTVPDRALLVAYRDSMTFAVDPIPADVPMPFVVHGRTSVFVATK
jgi:SAM-dependent methyltransferase